MNRTIVAFLGAGALVAGCGGNGTGPDPETLTGTWEATRVEFTDAADAGVSAELIALGGELGMTLSGNGAFTIVIRLPGELPETWTGTWSSSQDVLTLTFTSGQFGEMQFEMSLSGTTLILEGGHTGFDFDDDGTDEEARVDLRLVRG